MYVRRKLRYRVPPLFWCRIIFYSLGKGLAVHPSLSLFGRLKTFVEWMPAQTTPDTDCWTKSHSYIGRFNPTSQDRGTCKVTPRYVSCVFVMPLFLLVVMISGVHRATTMATSRARAILLYTFSHYPKPRPAPNGSPRFQQFTRIHNWKKNVPNH